MKEKKLVIRINKPVGELFDFLINPINTPSWISSMIKEETNEWPVKVGTIYRNVGRDGVWNEYTLAKFELNKMFELIKSDGNYHVMYTFKELEANLTEFEYFEWVENGELEDPFTQDILEVMKSVVENDKSS